MMKSRLDVDQTIRALNQHWGSYFYLDIEKRRQLRQVDKIVRRYTDTMPH